MNDLAATVARAGDGPVPPAAGSPGYRQSHVAAGTAADYDRDFYDPGTAKGLNWVIEQQILDTMLRRHTGRGSRALDFACGTGRVLELLERYVEHTVGIDVSSDMLEIARSRCRRSTVVIGDLTRDPGLLADPFDLVTAFRFFLNAEPDLRRDALRALRAALTDSGVLVANFHLNPISARGLYLRARWLGRKRTPMVSPHQVTELINSNGFEVLDVVGYEFLPYRRDGRRLRLPRLRALVERHLAGRRRLNRFAGSFVVVARAK